MTKDINWDLYFHLSCRNCGKIIIRRNGETLLCDICRKKEINNYYS